MRSQASTATSENTDEAERLGTRNALVEAHLSWARQIAKSVYLRVRVPPLDWADYVQAATVGLIEAAGRFVPERGTDFRGFALRRVRGAVFDSLKSFLRSPSTATNYNALQERAQSIDENELDPLERMVELVSGLTAGLLLELDSMLAAPVCNDLYASVEREQAQRLLRNALERLPERERFVVSMHYLNNMAFVEIAQALGLTKGRVSQLHRRAIGNLRKALGARSG